MIYRLIVPGTLEGMSEVRVLEWHGTPGRHFEPGALIVELETHKAVIEVRAGQAGVLRQRACEEGAWCALEGLLALLSDDDAEPLPETADDLQLLPARFAIS